MAAKRQQRQTKRAVKRRKTTKKSASAVLPTHKQMLNSSLCVTPLNSIFPKRMTSTLVYSTSVSLTTGDGNSAYITYKLNGLFDPLPSVGGHQPRGYDQLAAIYTRYVVHYAEITLSTYNNPKTVPTKCFIFAHKERTPPLQYAGEEPGTTTKAMGGGVSATPQTLKAKYSIAKMSGKNVWANETVQAAVGTDPAEEYYVTVGARTSTKETLDAFPDMDISIFYRATFFDQRDLADS